MHSGFCRVQLQWNESLQALAARELNSAAQWALIATMNNLKPPYVTGDRNQAGPHVAFYGDTLIIPAPQNDIAPGLTASEDVFKRDVQLTQGRLVDAKGDLVLIAGRENLKQALVHRIVTEPGELVFHLRYGCDVHELKGRSNDPAAALRAQKAVERTVRTDPRITSVTYAAAKADGDTVQVTLTGMTVTGHPVDMQAALME